MCNVLYSDKYEEYYSDYNDMLARINEYTKDTDWIPGVHSNKIKIESMTPIESAIVAADTGIPYDAVFDTGAHTNLLMEYNGNKYLLRNTAISSILNTAKINGSALSRLTPYQLAEVLNTCLTVARGDSLLLFRGSKICACLSDSIYKIMPIKDLLDCTTETLSKKFGELKFIQGENSYSYTSCLWEIPEMQDELLDKYDSYVATHRKALHGHAFMPAIKFITSDVGNHAATLIPLFRMNSGTYFRINSGIKVDHKRGSSGAVEGVEAYENNIQNIFAKFCDIQKTIGQMSRTEIRFPLNALVGMCKKAGIAKKYASEAYEEIENFSNGSAIFMDDLYLSIANCVAYAKRLGVSGIRLLDIEESIAKILNYNWKEFDIAGNVCW